MRPILILRPQPRADATAAKAQAMGLAPVVAPLFVVRPIVWTPPPAAGFDAVILTSANAARLGGDGLASFLGLPCYTVGEATAAAASEAGFIDVHIGPADGEALARMMAERGVKAAFHPCGQDRRDFPHLGLRIEHVPVYAAEPVGRLPPEAEAALRSGALVLVHSPRAAALFAGLVPHREQISIAAISPAAAEEAGTGWRSVAVAERPRDEALLELAAKLCQNGRG